MEQITIMPINIESELKTSFLDYSMSVIVSRALPDVRDGLKPVHRRILYAMDNLKNYHNRPYLKSARIVGDVIGKYHPHGDSPVYEAMVRMAQDFSLRYPLVDGQGNFGSIDGDSAAAMRYTESRMEELSEFLLSDLDKETVDFVPNYDNKEHEPTVLPARVPQLLINGSSGIAVGMATNIPPHNLGEILTALEAYIKDPSISIEGLLDLVKGPDFPTAGEIHGVQGIREAYRTGRGAILVRAKADIESSSSGKEKIIIREIPFQVNKAKLIEKIADLVRNRKLEGVSDIRDESARKEIRVVVDVKRGESSEVLLNNLFKLTPMQSSFGVNLVALVRGIPKILNLKEMIAEFYQHRREVVLRRTAFLLRKSEERAHILLGLKIAVENAEDVIALIRSSKDTAVAQESLVKRFELSELQAKAILDMRLARLTGLEMSKIVSDYQDLLTEIVKLKNILREDNEVTRIVLEELVEIREKFADERRTKIFPKAADEFTMESLIADENVAVTITHGGYVKRTALTEISSQKRGGRGKSGMLMKEEDFIHDVFITSNHQDLLCFTNTGKVYNLKVYELPEAGLRSRGTHFANLINFEKDERIVSTLPIEEYKKDSFVFSVTKKGYIKKTELMAYSNVRSTGIIGLKLDEGDSLVGCEFGKKGDEILIATRLGKAIRFTEEEVRAVGRASRGVTAIRFSDKEDCVIGIEILRSGEKSTILSACENGFGKRTGLEEYRLQTRGGKGTFTIKVTERNGPVVGICQVHDDDQIVMMTSAGKLMRFNASEISIIGRHTQGVRLMHLSEGEKVIGIEKVASEDGEGTEDGEE
ncbi:MAG: DNA gyrase subunit A [Deltaproteobacteria bacterium]|nr:DNA gyrase subunit A [Deltaproteobacteria bacterium]